MWCIALPSSRSCQLSLCKLTHVNKFFCKHSNWVLFLYPWPHRSWWISSLFHTSDFLAKCYFKFSSRSQSPRNYMHIPNWLLFNSEVILYVCAVFLGWASFSYEQSNNIVCKLSIRWSWNLSGAPGGGGMLLCIQVCIDIMECVIIYFLMNNFNWTHLSKLQLNTHTQLFMC